MMSLQFIGTVWGALIAAVVVVTATVVLYRRQPGAPWTAMGARIAVAIALSLMVAGPVVRLRRWIGNPLQVRIVLDHSASMSLKDSQMEPGRKLLAAYELGWTDLGLPGMELLTVADELALVRGLMEDIAGTRGATSSVERLRARLEQARRAMESVPEDWLSGVRALGGVTWERWDGIGGDRVEELTRSAKFRGPPDRKGIRTALAVPEDGGDQYGERLRGYLVPPVSGEYVFWIAGDDGCELWLSPNEDPEQKSRIAYVEGWTGREQWEQTPSQRSRRIKLEAGRRYYVEVLHKEGNGEAHVAARWQWPDGTVEAPIPGSRLVPFESDRAVNVQEALQRDLFQGLERWVASIGAGEPNAWKESPVWSGRVAAWEAELRRVFLQRVEALAAEGRPAIRAALERFDRTTRWERLLGYLWRGRTPLLRELASAYDVRVLGLHEDRLECIWESTPAGSEVGEELPVWVQSPPTGRFTDLSRAWQGLEAMAPEDRSSGSPRCVLVLCTDGRHNHGATPVELARVLGGRGVPVFTVVMGSTRPPRDLAVVSVDTAPSVYHRDRVRGTIVVQDHMPSGRPFTLRIVTGDRVVWEKSIVSSGEGRRTWPFEFAIEDLTEAAQQQLPAGVRSAGVRLDFRAVVSLPDGDEIPENDQRTFSVFAVTRKYRILHVDGRPRWEARYIRNIFQRDEKWEVTSILYGDGPIPMGEGADRFPASRDALMGYDLVIFGEVPPDRWPSGSLEWLRDFVGERGGGWIFLDGSRGELRRLEETPLRPLLLGERLTQEAGTVEGVASLRCTPAGRESGALNLAAKDTPEDSFWSELEPPRVCWMWKPRPDVITWLEGVRSDGSAVPLMMLGRYGAGRVALLAMDEIWRWRSPDGEARHTRFWNQLAMAVMEAPYAARDARVALDAGPPVQPAGSRLAVRARVRDAQGRAVENAIGQALVYRDGRRVVVVPMAADEYGGYRAETEPLPEGEYEVRVTVSGVPESDTPARVRVALRAPDAGELAEPRANEDLLRQIATVSGGATWSEESLSRLLEVLRPYRRGQVVEREVHLARSWPWLISIVLLLTVEWVIRKWRGLP